MEAVIDSKIAHQHPRRRRRVGRFLIGASTSLLVLAISGILYVEWKSREPVPLPHVEPIDPWSRLFDLRPTTVITTANWLKFPIVVPRHQFLTDHTIWLRMHFEDWDRLPADVRTTGLDRMLARYGPLVSARRQWPTMTANDWDRVPQPIRAMVFVSMIEHWVDFYAVGEAYGLDRREVRRTIKAIAMTESWFDHRAFGINSDGSIDIGLGGASAFARRTIRRWYREGWCDFTLSDEDYQNPWLASRWLAFWFSVVLDEANGDLGLAVRAYNWGIGRAIAGEGQNYLAAVERRRARYFEGPSRSFTWRRLSTFRRARQDSANRRNIFDLKLTNATIAPACRCGALESTASANRHDDAHRRLRAHRRHSDGRTRVAGRVNRLALPPEV